MNARKKFVIFDGHALLHRGYHAIPYLSTKNGTPTNGVFGFTTMMLSALRELKPDYAAVGWDMPGKTFRHDIYPDYKGTRAKADQDLIDQIPVARDLIKTFSMPLVEAEGYEADDVIGTLSKKYQDKLDVFIVTGDMDELQLVSPTTKVYTLRRGFSDTVTYDEAAVEAKYGVTPEEFIVFKALKGDPSDNIPGVVGIGDKTATELVSKYHTLKGIYDNLDKLTPAIRNKLENGKAQAELSYDLAKIKCDVPLDFNLKDAALHDFDRKKVYDLFHKLEFRSLLSKLPSQNLVDGGAQQSLFSVEASVAKVSRDHLKSARYVCVDTEAALEKLAACLQQQAEFAFDTETDSLDVINANLVGVSFCWEEGTAYYVPLGHRDDGSQSQAISSSDLSTRTQRSSAIPRLQASDLPRTSSELENLDPRQLPLELVLNKLQPILENRDIKKIGHNIKFDYEVLKRYDITLGKIGFDTMVAAFLLNPIGRAQTLSELAYGELGISMIEITELIGARGKNQLDFSHVPIEKATEYGAEDTDLSWRLYKKLVHQLRTLPELNKLAQSAEWPLIEVLGDMEVAGVLLDVEFLAKFAKEINANLSVIEEDIWKKAGEKFNISSTQQLKVILFDKLKLQSENLKKIKTGVSTAAKELEKMRGAHPIINLLFKYREVMKLKNTYVDTLPKLVNPTTGAIHTSYNQTIAQTGRLSSTNPNLQNIPIRSTLGREIRKAFIAGAGNIFVSADYSQIELRLAAELADDQPMIKAFREGVDIHTLTAAEMFQVDPKDVTKQQRYAAKTINFGVLYGMNPHGLSVATGLDIRQAKEFIERYFEIRRGVAEYIESIKVSAREKGYTETLYGRRRPCLDVRSSNYVVRAAAERAAVNMPLQGTAADMMKLAMVAVHHKLPIGAQMILQIHDELIVECPEAAEKQIAGILKEEMIGVAKFNVPIEVGISSGKSWGELE